MKTNYFELLDKYAEHFGDGFPTMEYDDWSNEQMCSVMEECLRKDKSVHLLYPRDIENVFY